MARKGREDRLGDTHSSFVGGAIVWNTLSANRTVPLVEAGAPKGF